MRIEPFVLFLFCFAVFTRFGISEHEAIETESERDELREKETEAQARRKRKERKLQGAKIAQRVLKASSTNNCDWNNFMSLLKGHVCGGVRHNFLVLNSNLTCIRFRIFIQLITKS